MTNENTVYIITVVAITKMLINIYVYQSHSLFKSCKQNNSLHILFETFSSHLKIISDYNAAAVAQSVRALAPQAKGWVFESQLLLI